MTAALIRKIKHIPDGYSEVYYRGKKYGVTRSNFNSGKSLKIYAEELGGNHFISFNFYETTESQSLKPCEMPLEDVIRFLENYES